MDWRQCNMLGQTERGVASLLIELRDSKITVRHGTTRETILTTTAVEGDWKKLWATIDDLGPEIPSADPYRAAFYGEDE